MNPSFDSSFDLSYQPLVDYTLTDTEDDDHDFVNALDQTIDSLKSHLATMKTTVTDDVCCRLRRRVQMNEQKKKQEKRVSMVLETEQREEEKRKNQVLKEALVANKTRSSALYSETFRRFSPRRVTMKGAAKAQPFKRHAAYLKKVKMTPKRQSAFEYLLLSEKLCFRSMD